MSGCALPGRIVGIDFGTVRVGIAISDSGQKIASPYENYTRVDLPRDAVRFRRLVEEEQVTRFVVGLPVHTDGQESQMSIKAREFGSWLAETTERPVDFFDERYTSLEAERLMNQAALTKKRRKRRLDMLAAQLLLSAYLESSHGGQEPPGSIE